MTTEIAETRKYELMVIFAGDLTEKDFEDELNELRNLLKENTKGIMYEDSWGKREFSTRIKKHSNGYYVFFNFEAIPAGIKELDDPLKLNQKVLRTLLIVLPDDYVPGRYKETVIPEEESKSNDNKYARPVSRPKPAPASISKTKLAVSEIKEESTLDDVMQTKVAGKEEEQTLADVEKKLDDILDNPDIDIK